MMRPVLLLAAICVVAYGQCPNIIGKSSWSKMKSGCRTTFRSPAKMVIVHHTVTAACSSPSSCTQQVRNIQNHHVRVNKWCDIGYNFLVGGDGSIYEGNGWGKVGAHAKGSNSISIGIAFIGTFQNGLPTVAARKAAQSLIRCGVSMKKIRPNFTLKGHKDVFNTACPGGALYNNLRTWARFKPGRSLLP